MTTVKVPTATLKETLKKNRATHETDFKEATEGYRIAVIQALENRLNDIKEGKAIDVFFPDLEEPVSHLKDYDREIAMLEMTEESHVTLTAYEFSQFVQDEWNWKETFLANSTTYKSFRGR